MYWLNGMAGTGKSTIARTVAAECDGQERLGASFFFARGEEYLSKSERFFTTIATQLANAIPDLKPSICKAIKDNPDINDRLLSDQWGKLIRDPLSKLNEKRPRILVVVIDALDECQDTEDIEQILKLLSKAKELSNIRLRIFITSRPETAIRLGFHKIQGTHHDFILHQVKESIIREDIMIFLRNELGKIHSNTDIGLGWPEKDKIEGLCQRANGLFIYAATACRFIADLDWDPNESLSVILKHDYVGQSPAGELDAIYTTILQHSIKPGARDKCTLISEFRRVVGSIVVLSETLPAEILARLLGLPLQTIDRRLRTLHSVLDISGNRESPIKLLHLSFRDFLLDPERCTDQNLRISEQDTHRNLFACCLRVMEQQLKPDICNLVDPGIESSSIDPAAIQQSVSRELQYSCLYWIHHLHASGIAVSDNDNVHLFLKQHTLHWLEALSLLKNISVGIHAIKVLESIMTVSSTET